MGADVEWEERGDDEGEAGTEAGPREATEGRSRAEGGQRVPADRLSRRTDRYVHDLREEAPAMNKNRTRAYRKAEEAGA